MLGEVDGWGMGGAGGGDVGGGGVGGRDDRRRLRRAGTAVIAAIGIGTGGTEHGATDEGERGGKAAAAPRARRVVIHRVVVRIERDVVLVVVLGRLSIVLAIVRRVVGVMLGLLVCPKMQLVIETVVGGSALGLRSRRMRVIPARGVARP